MEHNIQVTPSEYWDDKWAEGDPPYLMGIIGNDVLPIAMPWGEEQLALPLGKKILLNPKE